MTSVNYLVSLPVSFCHHVSMLLMLVGGLVSLRVGDTKQGFTPILTNSAPAVVGSNVTFYTVLYNCNETSANLSHFTYVWTHNAQIRLQRQRTVGGCSSQISLQFSSSHPGLYTMSVKVCDNWMGAWTSTLYDNEEWTGLWDSTLCLNETPVGLGATIFNLTDALNGNLALRQNNPVIHTPHVYLTNTTISIGVDITDQITNVNFLYTWRVNGSVLATTLVPSYCHTFHAADWYTVEALVNMSSNGTYRVNSTRYGVFGKHIQLKDAVSHLVYSGNRSFPVGSLLHANISWDGSAPFRLSWNVSGTTSCSQTIIVSQPLATLDVPLYSAGNYVLTIDVANDWSGRSKQILFTVLRPDAAPSGASASIVFLCTMIGLVAVAVTFISYRRDRQLSQRHLEVADFNFHHTTPTSSVGHCVATLRHKWRHLWTLRVSRDGVPLNSYDQL